MIYLRPSRRITSPGEGDPLLAGIDILDEYMRGLQRARTPFTLVIESDHGSDLDEDGVRETVLHLRIYGHDGNDLTDLLPADFAPEWCLGTVQVGVGMSLALTWQDVKTYSTTYSVTLTAWRIYEALATQEPVEPGIQRLLREISCRGEFILQGSIRLVNDRLELIASDLSSAKSELEKKLDATDFNSFKATDFKTASDRLASAESSLKSHASELQKKLDASDFNSFKADDFKRASDRLASAESSLKSHASEIQKKVDMSAFVRLQSRIGEITAGKTLAEQVRELPTSSKVSEMLHSQARSTYTVRVFTTGQIRNGKMDVANPTDPITQQPAVLHSALANNLLSGQATADFYHSLKWTINKGRTTAPLERTVTGPRCYVLAQDIVTPSDGSAPYYDIQLERLT